VAEFETASFLDFSPKGRAPIFSRCVGSSFFETGPDPLKQFSDGLHGSRLVLRPGNVNRRSGGNLVVKNCWLGLTLVSVPQLVFGLADGFGNPSLPFSLARSPARKRQYGIESFAFAQ